jgi:hypothetical protein
MAECKRGQGRLLAGPGYWIHELCSCDKCAVPEPRDLTARLISAGPITDSGKKDGWSGWTTVGPQPHPDHERAALDRTIGDMAWESELREFIAACQRWLDTENE